MVILINRHCFLIPMIDAIECHIRRTAAITYIERLTRSIMLFSLCISTGTANAYMISVVLLLRFSIIVIDPVNCNACSTAVFTDIGSIAGSVMGGSPFNSAASLTDITVPGIRVTNILLIAMIGVFGRYAFCFAYSTYAWIITAISMHSSMKNLVASCTDIRMLGVTGTDILAGTMTCRRENYISSTAIYADTRIITTVNMGFSREYLSTIGTMVNVLRAADTAVAVIRVTC